VHDRDRRIHKTSAPSDWDLIPSTNVSLRRSVLSDTGTTHTVFENVAHVDDIPDSFQRISLRESDDMTDRSIPFELISNDKAVARSPQGGVQKSAQKPVSQNTNETFNAPKSAENKINQYDFCHENLRQQLQTILLCIESSNTSESLDGLLTLSIFLDENKEHINWNSLKVLCDELLRFLPSVQDSSSLALSSSEQTLTWDVVCDCLSQMCHKSASMLYHAQRMDAVPRILRLLQANDSALQNSACRALGVLTDSSDHLKLVVINHEATRSVLLQELSTFCEDLKGTALNQSMCLIRTSFLSTCSAVALTFLASTVYGMASEIKESVMSTLLLRDIACCIQSTLPNGALSSRAACILLCNLLAGCDENVTKVRQLHPFFSDESRLCRQCSLIFILLEVQLVICVIRVMNI
jgi:hypothetical protein